MICNEKRIEELYHNDCEGDYVEAFEHLTKEHLTTRQPDWMIQKRVLSIINN